MPGRPMLLHRMALVSFRLFCKNLGNLHEFFGQMVYRPPLAENCPYAYGESFTKRWIPISCTWPSRKLLNWFSTWRNSKVKRFNTRQKLQKQRHEKASE